MLSTSSKIAFGYILLIGLLIGSVKYIYTQLNVLSERTELEMGMNYRRQTTHKIISKLYEIEIIGQTLHLGKSKDYKIFQNKMKEVQLSIDTLQTLLTDTMQCHRLDTLRALLKYKSNNTKAVIKALKQTPTDLIYQQQFDSLLTQQDSMLNSSHVRRRIITHHNTYTIHHKPKGFFKRIADVFVPGKTDSTEVSNLVQEEFVDTLEEAYNPIDTIASMLTDIHNKVLKTRQEEIRTLDRYINRLRMAGSDLSRRVNQLLETIEHEEQEAVKRKIVHEQEVRTHATWTLAIITTLAIILSLAFFTIISHDLTRSNHYRKELEKAKLYAENLLVAREKLMLTITHDIKAPAGSIIGYLDLLTRLIKDKRQLFYLNNMQSAAQHLLNLVTSLLDFHRLEAGKMDLSPVSFKPYQLLEDIYHCFLPLAEKKGIQLIYQPELSPTLTLEGDPFRLRQIVENLLSNALKFTSKGKITLCTDYQGNQFIISVSDTGCGMTEEEQLRIFTEFTRLHSARGQEGFGLGLSITRKLIDLQSGKISVQSNPGAGSTFTVSIPLPSYGSKDSVEEKENWILKGPKRLRFLLVDDDKIQMQLTEILLHQVCENHLEQNTQIDICCCEEPEEVLSLLERENFDLIFTDIQMPAMNGFELLTAIRKLKNQETALTPIVAITARSDMDKEDFKQQGFAGMLQKPFNQTDLVSLLTDILSLQVQKENENMDKQTEQDVVDATDSENNEPEEIVANFTALTAFSEGDNEAAKEIINTFIAETEKNMGLIVQAMERDDTKALCEIAHKMLPTFTMLEIKSAISDLQWLENNRYADVTPDDASQRAQRILECAQSVIKAARKLV